MFESIKRISRVNEWRKEITGLPTYLAGGLLSLTFSGSSIVGSLLIFICFVVIYHFVYEFMFPEFEASGSTVKLATFFMAQVAFWVLVFFSIGHYS